MTYRLDELPEWMPERDVNLCAFASLVERSPRVAKSIHEAERRDAWIMLQCRRYATAHFDPWPVEDVSMALRKGRRLGLLTRVPEHLDV